MDDVSEKTKRHLTRVYTTIMGCALVCAFGMYINASINIHGFFMNLLSILVSIFFVYKVSSPYESENRKIGYLAALAF